jgi:hypothetical protein
LLATACGKSSSEKQRETEAKKVTVSSEPSATEEVVDEDYRFRLDWPGKGWKLLSEKEIRKMSPDAVAGAMYQSGKVYGAIIVESATSTDLDGMVKLIQDGRPVENPDYSPTQKLTFAGNEAARFEMRGQAQGVPVVMDTIIFLHDDYAYQLVGWTAGDSGSASFDAFFNAFSITEGKVVGRTAPTISTAHGVGWRVMGGVFESAVAGMRIRPKHGFRLTVGEELAQTNADAEVGWTRQQPHEVFGQVIVEPAPETKPSADYLKGLEANFLTSFGATSADVTKTATVAGIEVTFKLARATDPVGLSIYHGVLVANGKIAQLVFWSLSAAEEPLWEAVVQAAETIELLSVTDREVLARELRAVRDPQNTITLSTVLRDGVFKDFAGGWSWKAGDGFWRLRAGAQARAVDPTSTLYMEEPTLGVYGTMSNLATEGADADAFHRHVISVMGFTPTPVASRKIAGADARTSLVEIVDPNTKISGTYHTTTITRGDRGVVVMFWGNTSHMKPDALTAAVDRLTLHEPPLRAVDIDGTRHRDNRMGYAVTLPDGSWVHDDETPEPFKELGSIVVWKKGGKQFGVISLNAMSVDQDADWFTDFVEQIFRDQARSFTSVNPTRSDTMLGGLPARELVWQSGANRLQLFIASRDRTFYAVMLLGKNLGIDVKSTFEFLD